MAYDESVVIAFDEGIAIVSAFKPSGTPVRLQRIMIQVAGGRDTNWSRRRGQAIDVHVRREGYRDVDFASGSYCETREWPTKGSVLRDTKQLCERYHVKAGLDAKLVPEGV